MSHEAFYEIMVKGHLDLYWSERLGGLQITIQGENTIITGHLVDQSALHGLLAQIRDASLTLLSVARVDPDEAAS